MSPAKNRSACAVPTLPVDERLELPGYCVVDVRRYGSKVAGTVSPVVVHFHGGAFVSGDLDNSYTVGDLLQGAGAVVVSVAYPLTPFPQPVETGYAVVQWAYRQRNKLGGTGASLYVAGEEAGGNLAASVCLMARDQAHPPLAGQILLSPMLDPCVGTHSLREATKDATACKWAEGWRRFLAQPRDAEHPYAVPAQARRLLGLPPTLVMVGSDDPMRDEALAYADRLQATGLVVQRHVFPKAEEWFEPMLQAGPHECPCAGEAKAQLRQFFEATRCPVAP